MKGKLYARELLKKLATKKELEILEAVWNEEMDVEEKIKALLEV